MDKLLTLWPVYAPSAAIVSLGLAMRTLWGIRLTLIAIWVARILFAVMGVGWEITTDSAPWIRVLNGIFAAVVFSVVFSKILESLCAHQKSVQRPATPSDSQLGS